MFPTGAITLGLIQQAYFFEFYQPTSSNSYYDTYAFKYIDIWYTTAGGGGSTLFDMVKMYQTKSCFYSAAGNKMLEIDHDNEIITMPGLPTSIGTAGSLWNDGGTLKIS